MSSAGLRGVMRTNVPLRQHTSWRVGGLADKVYQPADLADFVVFLQQLPEDEPLFPLGLGSNLLVRDGGLRGTVVLLHGALTGLELKDAQTIYVEAGVPGAKLARFAALHELVGAEFFAGIPGTLGGMLSMNAGCYGSETWQHVLQVQTIGRRGELRLRTPAEYEVSYRHVCQRMPTDTEFFVAAWLKFAPGVGARESIKTLLKKRIASQPLNLPNAGSVFRNPPNDHAARLIEQCGLKGKRIGGAQVSEKHANFIVNLGEATARDIEQLITDVQKTVALQTGVSLHGEVRIVGDALP